MQQRLTLLATLFVAGSALLAGKCQPTSVSLIISGTSASATTMIYADSNAPYVDGQDGASVYINTGCTDDLIVDLNSSTRKVGFSFTAPVYTNSFTPSWASTPFYASGAYLTVLNVMLNYNPSAYYTFTTSAALQFTPPGGSTSSQDRAGFCNPQANNYTACGGNNPNETSLLLVTHYPAGYCPSGAGCQPYVGSAETWTIAPEDTNQIGDLLVNSKKELEAAGQFTLPFLFIVTRN